MPHSDGVLALAFQPGLLGQQSPCLVSIGLDSKFKIWRLVDDTDIYREYLYHLGNLNFQVNWHFRIAGKKEAWTCDVAGDFRQMQPTAISFSEDGSLLAISFEDIVTFWNPQTSNFKTSLAHTLIDQPIR